VGATLQDPRTPSLTLSAAQDLAELIAPLQEWQPHVLTGYPSVLGEIADAQLDGRLHIRPAQVFTGGEQLTAAVRRAIEAAWGTQPFDQYATTEAGFVAIECRQHDGLHVLDDHVVVEVVDAEGRPVGPGTEGARVLVTVLGSRTVPLVRYELGDVAVVAEERCRCGRRSPRLRSLATGARALLRLPGADGGEVRLHPVAVTSVLDAAPVRAWQVVQERDRLRVLVVGARPGFDPGAVVDALRRSLAAGGARVPEIRIDPVESLVRAPSGKASLVISDTPG
jgi:phenylacetate-CoA ligase